jgi:CBS-domain-containing membrane protein
VAKHLSPDTPEREVMSKEVLYCFEDEEIEQVARNMADVQVRRLPVINRDKRLVGIVSLCDVARKAKPDAAGKAVAGISKPGGKRSQTAHA